MTSAPPATGYLAGMSNATSYPAQLRELQVGLVRYQAWALKAGAKALVIFEGRDGAGKDGTIARITEHLAPRATRIISLPKPSDRERSEWYFQRYVRHLPAGGEFVIFNRSWYNRAGVEPVMGFCTPGEHEDFLRDVPAFERMLEEAQMPLVKIWLDISKQEQAKRLHARREDPLRQLKISDLDMVAQKKWKDYSAARDQMLLRTHTPLAPWVCVRADHKKRARLSVMGHLIQVLAPADLRADVAPPDPDILFPFEESALTDGRLAK
jgi:polyphosphate kinase 2